MPPYRPPKCTATAQAFPGIGISHRGTAGTIPLIRNQSRMLMYSRKKGIYKFCDTLYPAQIPRSPPRPLNSTEERERKLAPHKPGMKPPIVDPTNIPIHIND
jgi:hypothetical protein